MTFMVSMKDYEGFGGFASLTDNQVEEFQKALSAGYQSPRTDGGGALRVESLEATLRIVTVRGEHIQLWRDVPKVPAFSTMHEWNIQTAYGAEAGVFTNEGEAGQVMDSAYLRKAIPLKFLSVGREVTHPMLLVRPAHGDIMALQTRDGALQLLQLLERAMFTARSAVVPQSFDGYDDQLRSDSQYGMQSITSAQNILDLRGKALTQDYIEVGTNALVEAYGRGTDLYAAPRAMSDFSKEFYAKQRTGLPAMSDGVAGGSFRAFESANGGRINLKREIFLRSGRNNGKKLALTAASASRAPTAPTIVAAAAASAGSLFTASDVGTYQYKVSAINRFGESAANQESGGQAVAAAGDGVTLTITDGGGGDPATGYRIYRSPGPAASAGTEQLMVEVPRVGAAATTVTTDLNRYIPGTSKAYLYQVNLNAMSVAQLAPMMKLPLATISAAIRWLHLLYCAPALYAPQWMYIFDNVADD